MASSLIAKARLASIPCGGAEKLGNGNVSIGVGKPLDSSSGLGKAGWPPSALAAAPPTPPTAAAPANASLYSL
jgi:hypothetical protein